MKKTLKIFLILGLFIFSGLASQSSFAASDDDLIDTGTPTYSSQATHSRCAVPKNIGELFTLAICILDYAVPFLVSLGLIMFLTGVIRFVAAGDNEEKRQGGRQLMIFGLIALFIMVSVWGFVNILSNTFFGKNSTFESLPPKSNSVFK